MAISNEHVGPAKFLGQFRSGSPAQAAWDLLYPPPRRRAFNSRPFAPQTSLVHCCVYRFARAMHRKSDKREQTEVAGFENDSQKTALELYFLIVTCELAYNEELI
jgi:hypothetical protein